MKKILKQNIKTLLFTFSVILAMISYMVALTLNPEKMHAEEKQELPPVLVAHNDLEEEIIAKRLVESFDSIMSEIEPSAEEEYDNEIYIPEVDDEASDLKQLQLVVDGEKHVGDVEAVAPKADAPRYELNAEMFTPKDGYAQIALIIDDVGVTPELSARTLKVLPKEVTLSFLPYGSATPELSLQARKEQHEVMIHLPMEAVTHEDGKTIYPGEDALYVEDSLEDIRTKTQKNLDKLKDISVGVNNHMGSRFTAYEEGMKEVLPLVQKEKLMFLDSLTTSKSAVKKAAQGLDMPLLKRHVFIDHYTEAEKIAESLTRLEKIARKNGHAVGIGHPHSYTLDALEKWLPTLEEKKIQLVPITAIINRS